LTTEAEKIAELAVKARGEAVIITTGAGREFLILPGQTPRDVSEPHSVPLNLPQYISEHVTVQTVDSLVAYFDRFKIEDSILLADIASNTIRGLLDYHGAGDPDHVAHMVTLTLPHSEEWKVWTGVDGKMMEQGEFARFLEENGQDVAEPAGADLLELCRDLHAIRNVDFRKAIRTDSDNESFHFSDETDLKSRRGGNTIDVPTRFRLHLPVYFGGQTVDLFAFLRWKLDDGNLLLGVKLQRREHVRQDEFKAIVNDVAARTERLAVFGNRGF
jgi:uncharacterized protein YfdQ (DUF2303 family)